MGMEHFEKTAESLERLSESLEKLRAVAQNKKSAVKGQREVYHNNMMQKNEHINRLKQAVAHAAERIGETTRKIDEVIKENGSGNNLH